MTHVSIGRLTDSFQRVKANPGEPLELKKFSFSSRTVSSRTVVGEDFTDYMSLPLEDYVVFDARLMRSVHCLRSEPLCSSR